MNYILFLFLILIQLDLCLAQKYDNVWVRGSGGVQPTPKEFKTYFMDFKTNPPTITAGKKNPPLSETIACISDSTGKLLFFTNLIQVFNAKEEILDNGNIINYGDVWIDFQEYGYPSISGAKIIPIFNDSLFLMIYGEMHNSSPYLTQFPIKYAIIDPYFQNSKGRVTNKDIPFHMGNTINYDFVKHGNGKDWWLILCEWNVNELEQRYYRYLVNENGIIDSMGMQKFDIPSFLGGFTRVNLEGNTYVRYDSGFENKDSYSIFNFDRCSGLLNLKSDFLFTKEHNLYTFELSPNGRYLYHSKAGTIFQIDLENMNNYLFIDTLSKLDGHSDNGIYPCLGFTQITPNKNIIVSPLACGSKVYSIIHQPDLPGLAADFEQHPVLNLNFATRCPQFPNYRLKSQEGSVCDTLGFKTNSNKWLFQNDIASVCVSEVQPAAFKKLILRIYNQEGDNVLEEQFFSTQSQYCLSTSSLLPADYYYYLWVNDKKVLKGKFDKL